MSDIHVEVVEINAILPHPNADRLEVVEILGTASCAPKGQFKVGDLAVWFPPGMLIPESVGAGLGVAQYLKPSAYPGDTVQTKCRVAAVRLRTVPSYGILVPLELAQKVAQIPDQPPSDVAFQPLLDKGLHIASLTPPYTFRPFVDDLKPGDVLDGYFKAFKYVPPLPGTPGCPRPKGFNADAATPNSAFHKYTDIQNFYRYAKAIPEGEPVRITEKIHGMNIRLGLVKADEAGEFALQAGSHNVNWKPESRNGDTPIWWQMMTQQVVNLLTDLCDEKHSVILFGELYGAGVQDMDYGAMEPTLRVFDISVDGRYLDWHSVELHCGFHTVETVPLLYRGPFSKAILEQHTYGPTTVAEPSSIKAKFKDREGCVVTPLIEQHNHFVGRVILKSVSADYLDRKNPQDN
jgi:RNA ligase (TIGR02306 family)